ncbi:hypothetical protein KA005_76275 [bacterium]|nr:hypothetical protein [bacterium]
MTDLYNALLKNTEDISFGVNLTNIIALKRKGEVVKTVKKLLVIYNGEKQDPIDCQSVEVKFVGNTIILDIVLVEDEEQQTENMPQTETVVPTSKTDAFILQGDDLDAFTVLSDFHREENQGQKTKNSKLTAYTLESGTFNIQDLMSVQNAVLDIVAKEKQFIDRGYKVFKTNTPPRFDYEDGNYFKLVESVVLIQPSTVPVETIEESK